MYSSILQFYTFFNKILYLNDLFETQRYNYDMFPIIKTFQLRPALSNYKRHKNFELHDISNFIFSLLSYNSNISIFLKCGSSIAQFDWLIFDSSISDVL